MDIFKPHKHIEENGGYIHKRVVDSEASYLSRDFLDMEKGDNNIYNVKNINLQKGLGKYLIDCNGPIQSDSYTSKVKKYERVLGKSHSSSNTENVLIEYSQNYGNHSASKRKKSFKSSVKYYKSAAARADTLNRKLDKGIIKRNSNEFVESRIDILKDRLNGMLEAAEAKSYSKNDEKLRKNGARAKIYTAMLRIYADNPEKYKKEIARLQRNLDSALKEYKSLMSVDNAERLAEEKKRRKKAGQVTSLKDMDIDQLRQEIRYIIRGEKLDYTPVEPKVVYYKDGVRKSEELDSAKYEYAKANGKLNRNIADMVRENPDEIEKILDRELENNNDEVFSTLQATIGAYKRALLIKEAELNGMPDLEKAISHYVKNCYECRIINDILRNLEVHSEGHDLAKLEKYAGNLKKGLNSTTLDYDLVVRRGVGLETIGCMMGLNGEEARNYNRVKEEITGSLAKNTKLLCVDNGVVSTTVFRQTGFNNRLDLVILCKKGTKALDISHNNGTEFGEEEVMLAPGTHFIIRKFKELETDGPRPRWRIYLETVTANDEGIK